ncbi:regulator of chromosome condensation 1/beta-lactamase-inhibitor protein II [Chytridium lagenaria]|nr:regulator of chromosome condensation 1/beta-lactamase-inhibitor protein II [Chytridium lagenaria]
MRVAASEVAGFALDENGQLWAWGRFRDVDGGSFFLQDRPIVSEPVNVSHLFGLMRIIDIAVGHNFMLYLTEDGCVHGWGVTSLGSLGPDFPNGRVALPSPRINLPDGFTVDRLFAGGYNTFILGTYSCGRKAILACGNNKEGELGVGILNSIKEWTEVSFKDFVNFDVGKVVEIAVGLEHTLFRTIDGDVYGCGTDRNGELGLEKGHMRKFCLPAKINVEPAIMVSTGTGGFHSYVVSKDAEVFVAGANTHWQLRYHGAAGGEELITKFSCREFVVQDEKRDVVFATGGIQFSVWGLEQD